MLNVFSSLLRTAAAWTTIFQDFSSVHRAHRSISADSSLSLPQGPVPGGSPLQYCNESRSTDLYSIEHIELYPLPLYIDDIFEAHLYGTILQNITNNATFSLFTRYGNSTQKSQNETFVMPFCDTMDSIDQPDKYRKQECPPEKGFGLLMMSAWVWPMFLVPGDYYFKFDAMTKEKERIYCLETYIHFELKDKDKWLSSS